MLDINAVRENLARVESKIAESASASGRNRKDVTLLAVTKTHPAEIISDLAILGVKDIGESYVQEAQSKMALLKDGMGPVRWHMIGHVQSRKAKSVVQNFDFLHSLDSVKLGRRLNRFAAEIGKQMPVLIQLNVSGEESKSGFSAYDEATNQDLWPLVDELVRLPNLEIQGLMSMAPLFGKSDQGRPIFARTRMLREEMQDRYSNLNLKHLSMGMSSDYEAAILEGSTIVRIGSAILGERPK